MPWDGIAKMTISSVFEVQSWGWSENSLLGGYLDRFDFFRAVFFFFSCFDCFFKKKWFAIEDFWIVSSWNLGVRKGYFDRDFSSWLSF